MLDTIYDDHDAMDSAVLDLSTYVVISRIKVFQDEKGILSVGEVAVTPPVNQFAVTVVEKSAEGSCAGTLYDDIGRLRQVELEIVHVAADIYRSVDIGAHLQVRGSIPGVPMVVRSSGSSCRPGAVAVGVDRPHLDVVFGAVAQVRHGVFQVRRRSTRRPPPSSCRRPCPCAEVSMRRRS